MKLVMKIRSKQCEYINRYSSTMLCVMMICVELGNKHSIMGIKISYLGCILFVGALLLDLFAGNLRLFSNVYEIRNFQLFLLAWLFYGIIQTVLRSLISALSLEGLILMILNVLIAFFLLENCNSMDSILRYINTVSIMLIICILISFWEISTGNHLVEITYSIKYYNLVFATFYNQNDYCTFLFLGIILQILGIKLTEKVRQKFFYTVIIILTGYIAYHTESRVSYICVALFFVFWFLYASGQKIMKKSVGFINIIIGVGGLFLLILCGGIMTLIYRIDPDRFFIYSSHFLKIGENVLFGYGPMMLADLTGYASHNLYIEFLGDFGIIFFVGFVYYTLIKFFKSESEQFLNPILCAYAMVLPILGCSSSNIQRIRIFWISIAICYAIAFYRKKIVLTRSFENEEAINRWK